ncbi:hypothetical protein L9F63_027892 [Diploptera punctata]|uniref:Uncharacterized protein n=1 Tax=Diploptera punctata TaxID=6984 RepID=A0AAD8A0H3_DIPPU|nr:hypothetical protein L9F63_006264 [Diploptera punctata]KAJ9590269.1 hypothetical protein L9F63_027892 [Diploptera punctata]
MLTPHKSLPVCEENYNFCFCFVLGGGLRVRRRPHRLPRGNKERRARGSIWLQSPPMGLTAEDTRQQVEEANISTNSISSSNSSIEDSDNSAYRSGEDSLDCKSCCSSDKEEKVWSKEEIQQLVLLKRREGLLDITMRTVNLMRRNQQLQHRLAALQAETRAFVRSVLSNPENQAIRELTLRSRRKLKSESDEEDSAGKKAKSEDENNSTIITNTTETIIPNEETKMEQDPSVTEGDGDK